MLFGRKLKKSSICERGSINSPVVHEVQHEPGPTRVVGSQRPSAYPCIMAQAGNNSRNILENFRVKSASKIVDFGVVSGGVDPICQ
jgi:hypothetical protein